MKRQASNSACFLLSAFMGFLVLNAAIGQEINYRFNHLTIDEGLAHTDATAVHQDDCGFIWIATSQGLNRYDGYEIKNFLNQNDRINSVYSNRINYLDIDRHGYIWLATQRGVECFDRATQSYNTIVWDNLPSTEAMTSPVHRLIYSQDDKLYLINRESLLIFSLLEAGKRMKFEVQLRINCEAIKEDEAGNIWVAKDGDVGLLQPGGKELVLIELFDQTGEKLPPIRDVLLTGDGIIWFGLDGGLASTDRSVEYLLEHRQVELMTYDLQELDISPGLPIPDDKQARTTVLRQDRNGHIWLGTAAGLIRLDPNDDLKGRAYLSAKPLTQHDITSNHVSDLFIDFSNCLWVTTYGGGVNYADLEPKPFYLLQYEPEKAPNTLSGSYIRAILEDEHENLWIGTRTNGLNYYDVKSNAFRHFLHDPLDDRSISSNHIRSLAFDKERRLWIGTGEGVNIFDQKQNAFIKLTRKSSGAALDPNQKVYTLAVDHYGQMWTGSWDNGVNRIHLENLEQYEIESIFEDPTANGGAYSLSSNRTTFIYADPEIGEVFIGTDQGLDHVLLDGNGNIGQILHYQSKTGDSTSLSSDFIWPIERLQKNLFWVGTLGGGLNQITLDETDPKGYRAHHFSTEHGAPASDIESLLRDERGNFWLGGRGISMFDPKTRQFTNYDVNDGLQSNSFKIGAAHKGASGRLYFGGTNGLNFFYPDSIRVRKQQPKLVLTGLKVNHEAVALNESGHKWPILEKDINLTELLRLSHLENNLSISFAALYYANPAKCKYEYMLEGFDRDWIQVDASGREATYSNLDFGAYTFKVKAANSDGIWTSQTKSLRIEVVPPWWKTIWAYSLYGLFLAAVIFGVNFAVIRWYRLKKAFEVSVLKEQQKETLHQLRLQFFTNISHDFKTPLSLIINPLEKLLNEEVGPRKLRRYYHMMYNNASRLVRLVNELMDFRKSETGVYQLRVQEQDLQKFAQQVVEGFEENAVLRDIDLQFRFHCQKQLQWFDGKVFEKVLFNLLGNAFKYTPSGGRITIDLFDDPMQFTSTFQHSFEIHSESKASSHLWLRVSDTGNGISEDSLHLIFDRYFTTGPDGENNRFSSGVGLAAVKSFVLLHRGNIHVYSEKGKGTDFFIALPKGKDQFRAKEIASEMISAPVAPQKKMIPLDATVTSGIPAPNNPKSPPMHRHKILLVEDNEELRHFISEHFQDEYQVMQAGNGQEALKILEGERPHIILSDIMMPEMDGIEFCRIVKEDPAFSDIPFLLLTAKNSVESKLEGTGSGADYYFAKPFSIRVLESTLQNLLASQKKLKERYLNNAFAEARELAVVETEKSFMDRFFLVVEENIDNTNFGIDELCRALGISRTNLYNKVKGATGRSVGELIRSVRLKKAAQILASEDLSVVQAMYRVGIQSQSYFTKSFKKEFGKTPTEFIRSLSRQNQYHQGI